MNDSVEQLWNDGDYQRIAHEHVIVSEKLCEQLGISARQNVLDVACGTGNTALAAAHRRAQVTGLDIAESLLDRARRRASAEGLENIRFVHGNALHMAFANNAFDVVLSTFGATFVTEQARMADELLRVTRPGGTIALTCYTTNSIPAMIYELGARFLPPPPRQLPAHAWSIGTHVERLFGARVSSLSISTGCVHSCFLSATEFLEHQTRWYAPLRARLHRLTEEQAAQYRQGIIGILEQYNRATDGTLMAAFDYAQIVAVKRAANPD